MAGGRYAESSNRILTALSPQSRQRLWPSLSRAHMPRGHLVYESGARITNLYFVERGLISLVKTMNGDRSVALGAVGNEGIAPPTAIFGIDHTIMESVVLISATVLSISLEDFRAHLADDRELAQLMQRCVSALLGRFAQTAACNVLHSVEARLARWLLVAHDSAQADTFALTHDFLATVLAVRRESVSIAAEGLRESALIHYRHGTVTVTGRRGLEIAACECYFTIRRLFDDCFARAAMNN
jgi:CRP-like cAMP-binding protein